VKREAASGKYHPTPDCVPMTNAEKLASLRALNFQEFDDVSTLAA
jgi:hypothetical protein